MPTLPEEQSTRDHVLALIRRFSTVSVDDLTHTLGLTRADIRYHLNALIDDGMVEHAAPAPSQPVRRGRPVIYYRLSVSATPGNLPFLCSALFHTLLSTPGFADPGEPAPAKTLPTNEILQAIAARMAAGIPSSAGPIQRLNQAVDYLNAHQYRARWEASPTGPRIMFHNCPYAAVIDQMPDMCTVDQMLLEQLTHTRVRQTARIDRYAGKHTACVFATASEGHLQEKP